MKGILHKIVRFGYKEKRRDAAAATVEIHTSPKAEFRHFRAASLDLAFAIFVSASYHKNSLAGCCSCTF